MAILSTALLATTVIDTRGASKIRKHSIGSTRCRIMLTAESFSTGSCANEWVCVLRNAVSGRVLSFL